MRWDVKKLGDVILDMKDGGTPSRKRPEYFGGDVNWCVVKDIKPHIHSTLERLTPAGLKNSSAKVWPVDSVIISLGATIGQVGLAKVPTATKQGLSGMVVNRNLITPEYLVYVLTERRDYIQSLASGTTIKEIRPPKLQQELSFPVPPLPEQQRIVGKLDAAFATLAEAQAHVERNRANARELFDSFLRKSFQQHLSRWEMKLLQDVTLEFGRGKSKHRPRSDVRLLGGKHPFIQTGDISNARQYITRYAQTYSEMGLAQSKLWPQGTICMAIVGVNLADTAILGFDACFPDSVIGIVVDDSKAYNVYVQYLLEFFKAELKEKGKGTARDNINLGMFQEHRFPFPSRTKQQEIAERLNVLRAEATQLEATYRLKQTELVGLKKALLGAAFRGEL